LVADLKPVPPPVRVEGKFKPPGSERKEVIILGNAGQRIITAGELLCIAGLTAGLRVTQKNEYDITVLRGPSISEIILSPDEIGFTGIDRPNVIVALSQEGVDRRKHLFNQVDDHSIIIQTQGVNIPDCDGKIYQIDFKKQNIKLNDRALAALSILAKLNQVIYLDMLKSALSLKFQGETLASALNLVERVQTN
jgi:Pyruvate/2-oxoacid:ferredoxin oxidoreductase gamma subunit